MRTCSSQTLLAALTLATLGVACAHQERTTLELTPGQARELKGFDPHRQTLIMPLRAGDVVPLEVVVDGDLVSAAPGASVALTVKRDCWVRIDDRGLRMSEDGKDFEGKARIPGSLQLGFGVTSEGPRATLRLSTPVR